MFCGIKRRRCWFIVPGLVLWCLLHFLLTFYSQSSKFESELKSGFVHGREHSMSIRKPMNDNRGRGAVATATANTPSGNPIQQCPDNLCLSLLAKSALLCYELCRDMTRRRTLVPPENITSTCKFRRNSGHVPVALVSVPGSGNTWVRGLLEKATGICTGSIYCDAPLRNKGFVGELVHDGSVLVVKTHTSDHQWSGMTIEKRSSSDAHYGSAILLVRNPYDTFVSERHRSTILNKVDNDGLLYEMNNDNSHVGTVGHDSFSPDSMWEMYVHNMSVRWQKTIVKWLTTSSTHPVLVVHYEDLVNNSLTEVQRMLDFLKFDYGSKKDLGLMLEGGYTRFKRQHNHSTATDYYTASLKAKVNGMIQDTIKILQQHKLYHYFHIADYII